MGVVSNWAAAQHFDEAVDVCREGTAAFLQLQSMSTKHRPLAFLLDASQAEARLL